MEITSKLKTFQAERRTWRSKHVGFQTVFRKDSFLLTTVCEYTAYLTLAHWLVQLLNGILVLEEGIVLTGYYLNFRVAMLIFSTENIWE